MRTARIVVTLLLAVLLVGGGLAAVGASSGWFARDASGIDGSVVAAQWAPTRDYLAALDAIAGEACVSPAPGASPTVEERYARVRAIVDTVIADLAVAGVPRPADIPTAGPALEERVAAVCGTR